MSIADRSLSRLRGSPLPGAGCLGPGSYVGCIVLPDAVVQVLRLALARLFCRALLRRLWPPVRFWVAVPLGIGLGAWPLSCVGASVLMGVAAAAMPPGRSWLGCAAWVWAGYLACVSRWCVYPVGCCCGGYAAGTLLAWLCPYNLGEHCTAPADMLRLHGTLPASFPLINNRPLSEGAAGGSRLGEGGYKHLSLRSR